MKRTRIKICGLTRAQDVDDAMAAGADALGFVFANSPRQLQIEQARGLTERVQDGIMRVGLFMDQPPEIVTRIVDQVPLELLQFHGAEDNAYCRSFGKPFIKAIAMGGSTDSPNLGDFPDASGLLLDAHVPGGQGGTGRSFDWRRDVQAGDQLLWLAGGLEPGNVARAIELLRPYAVDVSSGVESAPGIKSSVLMKKFVEQVKRADYGN